MWQGIKNPRTAAGTAARGALAGGKNNENNCIIAHRDKKSQEWGCGYGREQDKARKDQGLLYAVP